MSRNTDQAPLSTKNLGPLEILNATYSMELQRIYSDLCILLRIFLYLPVTVLGLSGLALLSIESQLAQNLNFKHIIHDFATKKLRQMAFSLF